METRDKVENLYFYELDEIKTRYQENLLDINEEFCFFVSINNILCLVYYKNYKIVAYNVFDNRIINEIKGIIKNFPLIVKFRHYLDDNNKRDLIFINVYSCIKLFNFSGMEFLLSIDNWPSSSICFLRDNNNIYIITSSHYNRNPIKIFGLDGKIHKIINLNEEVYYIDTYYDKNLLKNYIITGNKNCVKSLNYNDECKIYNTYIEDEGDEGNEHTKFVINIMEK